MELVNLVEYALARTTFRTGNRRGVSVEELRHTLSDSYWGAPARKLALSAQSEVPDEVVDRLASDLSQRLDEYIDASSGRIGHSFRVDGDLGGVVNVSPDYAVEVKSKSDLGGLAFALVRAAALVGCDSAARLIDGWAHGEPLRFKVFLVLAGLYAARRLELDAGLRVYPLPISSEGLPLSMPDADWNRVSTILGHTVLEIDVCTSPVFFQPPADNGQYPDLETHTILPGVTVERFLTALSLVSNRGVGIASGWNDYGDAAAFATGSPSGLSGPGPMELRMLSRGSTYDIETSVTELREFRPPLANLDANSLRRAWELVEELDRRMDANSRFRIAVRRWEQSVSRSASREDRFIDLRIALESLYLDSNAGELSFRLSTTCARHLGTSLDERRDIYDTLRSFYGRSSNVIHGTEVGTAKGRDLELLKRAGELCRDGILKIVETKDQPEWSDLLLA